MTILNAYVGGDRAWIAVDTHTIHHADGREFECQKMIPLIHLNAVMACRGTAAFLPIAYQAVAAALLQFDELVEQMPRILRVAFDEMFRAATAAHIKMADDIERETIVLIGWSARHQQMVAAEYLQLDRNVGFVSRTVGPGYFSPWADDMQAPDFSDPFDRAAMRQLATMQVHKIEQSARGAAGGGRYILAQLREDSITIETICELCRRHQN